MTSTPIKPSSSQRGSARKKLGRWVRRAVLVLFIAGVVAMVIVASLPKPVVVSTRVAQRGELIVTVDEDGKARVKDRYVVSAPLTGNVTRPELKPGHSVKHGDTIARLVPSSAPLLDARSRKAAEARVAASRAAQRQAAAQVERAKAALAYASKEASLQRQMVAQAVSSDQALDQATLEERARTAELTSAEFGAKVAAYEVEMALATLGRHTKTSPDEPEHMIVPSPITGRVLRVIQESEGVVMAGAPLVEVGDPAALEVVVDVLTSDAVAIKPGAAVFIERWGGEPLRAHVRLVEPSAFTKLSALGVEEQRVLAVIDLDSTYKEWAALGDGYRVEARIVTSHQKDVLKVPASALFRHDGEWALFAVSDGHAVLRRVAVGERNALEIEVKKGLSAGERVVVHPSDSVQDGVEVSER